MTCPECGGQLRLVLINRVDAEIQEVGAEIGKSEHEAFYRCESCGVEFVEVDDGRSSDYNQHS